MASEVVGLRDEKSMRQRQAVLLAIVANKKIRPVEIVRLTGCGNVETWLSNNADIPFCEDDKRNLSIPSVLGAYERRKKKITGNNREMDKQSARTGLGKPQSGVLVNT
jgi:hypothetical protein